MDVDAYLARIGATRDADLATLHHAHIRAVPFENYDIQDGVPLSLDPDALFDKIVRRGRGGFCYELNGLFALLLEALGHAVTLVSAFELAADGTRGPDFEHARLLVDDAWIVDVGNGARWDAPVPLQVGGHGAIRVARDGDVWWTERGGRREWAWTPTPRALLDFLPRCRFQERDPASHFVQQRMASLAVEGGRIALLDGVFSETGRPDREVGPEEERTLLAERFGIARRRPLPG